jgi:hypothetical protein
MKMNLTTITIAALLLAMGAATAQAGTVNLWGVADSDAAYYEYLSNAFFRMDLYQPAPYEDNQRFHDISDPSIVYGSDPNFDGFPNDENFRLGSVTYDESALTGGSGVAPITALSLGVGTDPGDSTYVNYGRWDPIVTAVDAFSGTVTVEEGQPVSIDLTSSITLTYAQSYGGFTATGYFNVTGNRFDGYASGDAFVPGAPNVWDFAGTLPAVPEPTSISGLALGSLWLLRRRKGR